MRAPQPRNWGARSGCPAASAPNSPLSPTAPLSRAGSPARSDARPWPRVPFLGTKHAVLSFPLRRRAELPPGPRPRSQGHAPERRPDRGQPGCWPRHLRALHCEVTGREDAVTRFLLCRLPGLSGKDWPIPFVRRRWNWGLWKLKPERGISAIGRSTWSLNRDGARATASERQSQDERPGPPEPPSPGAATQLQAAGGDPPGTGGLGRGGAGGGGCPHLQEAGGVVLLDHLQTVLHQPGRLAQLQRAVVDLVPDHLQGEGPASGLTPPARLPGGCLGGCGQAAEPGTAKRPSSVQGAHGVVGARGRGGRPPPPSLGGRWPCCPCWREGPRVTSQTA